MYKWTLVFDYTYQSKIPQVPNLEQLGCLNEDTL